MYYKIRPRYSDLVKYNCRYPCAKFAQPESRVKHNSDNHPRIIVRPYQLQFNHIPLHTPTPRTSMNEEQGQQHSHCEPPAARLSVALDILFSDADREIGPPPDLQHCLGPIDNLLAEAQALPSGVHLLERTLRHRFRFIARMFLNADPAGRLARLMHFTGAVITGTPALAFMNPSVLVQLSARALTGGTGVDNTIADAIHRLSLHPIVRKNFDEPFPVENAAFTHLCYRAASLLPFFDDLPLDPRPNQHIFTTLPICLRDPDIPRFLHLFIRDGYVEILESGLDLIHKIPDGHLIDVEFSDIRILRHAERQTYVLLLGSHSGSAALLLFRSHCTADHIFYNDTFAFCAYPQTTLRSQAITTKPLTNLQTRELLRLGFTIHNDFSAWANHDCSSLPHCPQRRRDILDRDNFFFRFRPSFDPQYDIKRLARLVLPLTTYVPI